LPDPRIYNLNHNGQREKKKTSEIKKEVKTAGEKMLYNQRAGWGLTKNPVVKNILYPTESSLWTMSS